MNAEKDDIRFEELFRQKLESAEVMPSPSFNSTLMKKLARREFMTFNPAKINIFYIGGAIVAGIATVFFLSLDKKDSPLDFIPENIVVNEDVQTAVNQIPVVIEIPEYSEQPVKTVAQISVNNETIIENDQSPVLAEHKTLDPAATKSEIINKEPLIDSRLVVNSKNNTKLFIPSALNGCAPLSVKFVVTSDEIDSCLWSFGSNDKSPTRTFTLPGEYKVSLEAFSSGRLVGVHTENITVYPRPTARFEINPDQAIIPDDIVQFINYSSGAVRYQWYFGDGLGSQQFEPLHRYRTFENYTVTFKAYNEYGCSDSVILHNAFADSRCYIEFPNAFIPNQNGPSGGFFSQQSAESAQVFYPVFFGVIDYHLKIFSQRGILIFESSDINVGWDGYFNGQLSNPGVYIWQVSGKYRTGKSFSKRGDVTLLKN